MKWITESYAPTTSTKDFGEQIRAIIFTDIDSTLIDEEGHLDAQAAALIKQLTAAGVPVIPVSSKSAAEVRKLRDDLGLDGPYIVENGSSIHDWPIPGTSMVWGPNYATIREAFSCLKNRYPILGFGDLSDRALGKLCSFDSYAAERAKDRSSTEPFFLVSACDLELLMREAEAKGYAIASGGRFFCLQGGQVSKGKAVRRLMERYRHPSGAEPISIGIGNAPNDMSMLRSVTVPVVMPDHCLSSEMRSTLRGAFLSDRQSWSEIMLEVFERVIPTNSLEPVNFKASSHV